MDMTLGVIAFDNFFAVFSMSPTWKCSLTMVVHPSEKDLTILPGKTSSISWIEFDLICRLTNDVPISFILPREFNI
ncbi:hypothetical protein D3C72_2298120 [compost metagenome]